MSLTVHKKRLLKTLPQYRDLYDLALKLVLDNLDASSYDSSVKHQILCRVNRMIAGVVSDNNPEGVVLDGYIYQMGLELIIADLRTDPQLKLRAEELLDE